MSESSVLYDPNPAVVNAPDPWGALIARIEPLAERLGIEPSESREGSFLVAGELDGRKVQYDIIELVEAVLDRLDAAIPPDNIREAET